MHKQSQQSMKAAAWAKGPTAGIIDSKHSTQMWKVNSLYAADLRLRRLCHLVPGTRPGEALRGPSSNVQLQQQGIVLTSQRLLVCLTSAYSSMHLALGEAFVVWELSGKVRTWMHMQLASTL